VSRRAENLKKKMNIEDIRAGKLKQLAEPIWKTSTSQALIFVASI